MSTKYIYEVCKNGRAKPIKKFIVKETPKTYVVSSTENDVWLATTIRKATMSDSYSRYYLDKEKADKFYAQLHQPPKKEKTADEMFAELGFTKNTSQCYENNNQSLYEKSVKNGTDIFQVYFNSGDVTYWDDAGHALWMQKDLLEAILKKMEEMGW